MKNLISSSISQVRSTKSLRRRKAFEGRAMPMEMVWGGSIGSLTTLCSRVPFGDERFMILMPKPWAIIERSSMVFDGFIFHWVDVISVEQLDNVIIGTSRQA